MNIRRYCDSDRERVWALHNRALEALGAHPGNGAWDDDLHHIEDFYLGSDGEFLVGLVEDEIVAMGALKRVSVDRAEIKRMRVDPGFHRLGYGRAVLDALSVRAVELGYGFLQLDTTIQQVPARGLYVGSGFAETGRSKMGRFCVIRYEKVLE